MSENTEEKKYTVAEITIALNQMLLEVQEQVLVEAKRQSAALESIAESLSDIEMLYRARQR